MAARGRPRPAARRLAERHADLIAGMAGRLRGSPVVQDVSALWRAWAQRASCSVAGAAKLSSEAVLMKMPSTSDHHSGFGCPARTRKVGESSPAVRASRAQATFLLSRRWPGGRRARRPPCALRSRVMSQAWVHGPRQPLGAIEPTIPPDASRCGADQAGRSSPPTDYPLYLAEPSTRNYNHVKSIGYRRCQDQWNAALPVLQVTEFCRFTTLVPIELTQDCLVSY
jgi:hypothetical protein